MTFIQTLTVALTAAIEDGDIESLRDTLVDLSDEAVASPEPEKRWYALTWYRLSEYDYGHIDQERLLTDLQALVCMAPSSSVVVQTATEERVRTQVNWSKLKLNLDLRPVTFRFVRLTDSTGVSSQSTAPLVPA